MKLKFVIPNMEETFGRIEFAGMGEAKAGETVRRGGRVQYRKRRYKLFSDVQRADDIEVIVSGKAGQKTFEQFETVRLINPRLDVQPKVIDRQGYADYILYADDIEKA